MIYFFMNGAYINHKGEEVNAGDNVKEEISERIDRIDVFYGSKANYELI